MSKQINLEEILDKIYVKNDKTNYYSKQTILFAMEEACKQTLKLASENAEAHGSNCGFGSYWVDKESILNTISQIV